MRYRALLPLALAPFAAIAYSLRQANAEADRSPRAFLKRSPNPGARVVAFLGASLLHGKVSFDAIDLLAERLGYRFDLVNAGKNGDLAFNARRRLPDVIACKPSDVIVLVGTNDVLASMSPSSERTYRAWKSLPEKPTLDWYRSNLEAIVTTLKKETAAKVALASLPPIGENLDDELNQKLHLYNEVIKKTAETQQIAYLKVHERLAGELQGRATRPPGNLQATMLSAAIERYLLRRSWDRIAEGNHFLLSTDGVHLNKRGATLLADVFAEHLLD